MQETSGKTGEIFNSLLGGAVKEDLPSGGSHSS